MAIDQPRGGADTRNGSADTTSCSLDATKGCTTCRTCRTCRSTGMMRWLAILILAGIWWFIPAPSQALSTKGEQNLTPWVGVGTGGLQVGVNYNAWHLTSNLDLNLGAHLVDSAALVSATAGPEWVARGERGRLGINPYVHVGSYFNYPDYGVGVAAYLQVDSPWGLRVAYQLSRNYYAYGSLGLSYRF